MSRKRAAKPAASDSPPVGQIAIAMIDMPERLRPVDTAWASALAASMEMRGLDSPIVVRHVGARYALVAGAHRLAAARLLGWSAIPATAKGLTDAEARLVEIDENLLRHELTALDRGLFLLERKRVWNELFPEVAKRGRRRKARAGEVEASSLFQCRNIGDNSEGSRRESGQAGHNSDGAPVVRFTTHAAEQTRLSERLIQRSVEIVGRLDPTAIPFLRASVLKDNEAQLNALSMLEPGEQVSVARVAAERGVTTVAAARLALGTVTPEAIDPAEAAFDALTRAWSRANGAVRGRFRRYLDQEDRATAALASDEVGQ